MLSLPVYAFICLFFVVTCEEVLFSERQNIYGEDKLRLFYERIQEPDVKYCHDRTRLLPDCTECIPGLQQGVGSLSCNSYISSSESIRSEIAKLTRQRFKEENIPGRMSRPYGLYPYLEKGDFMVRQELFGLILSKNRAQNIVDIGAYYNPIHLFLDSQSNSTSGYCPKSVLIIEPILDALSVMIPCKNGDSSSHIIVLPITFRHYMKQVINRVSLPKPDSVVCIGCDSHYGPNRHMLETTFARPFDLFLEYPPEYIHNGPMNKMLGNGPGEKLLFHRVFYPHTNDTEYRKRSLKIIHYDIVQKKKGNI
jgi:hypothetical protein